MKGRDCFISQDRKKENVPFTVQLLFQISWKFKEVTTCWILLICIYFLTLHSVGAPHPWAMSYCMLESDIQQNCQMAKPTVNLTNKLSSINQSINQLYFNIKIIQTKTSKWNSKNIDLGPKTTDLHDITAKFKRERILFLSQLIKPWIVSNHKTNPIPSYYHLSLLTWLLSLLHIHSILNISWGTTCVNI